MQLFKANCIIPVQNLTLPNQLHPEAQNVFVAQLGPTYSWEWDTPTSRESLTTFPAASLLGKQRHLHSWDQPVPGFVPTYLCAHNLPIGAVASVAVFFPRSSIQGHMSVNGAMPSGLCIEMDFSVRDAFVYLTCLLDHFGMGGYLLDSGVQFCLPDRGIGIRWSRRCRWSPRRTERTGTHWYLCRGKTFVFVYGTKSTVWHNPNIELSKPAHKSNSTVTSTEITPHLKCVVPGSLHILKKSYKSLKSSIQK